MSPTTPFRSHLLQQWTQQGRRPPAAAMPWLRPAPTSPSSQQDPEHQVRHLHHRHQGTNRQQLAEPRHRSSQQNGYRSSPSSNKRSSSSSSGSSESPAIPSLSSIDDSSFQSSWSRMTSSQHFHSRAGIRNPEKTLFSPAAFSTASVASQPEHSEHDNNSISKQGLLAQELQSLLRSRQTAAKPLLFSTAPDTPMRQEEIDKLRPALDRAVQAAMMAPNHKRTEPFSFKRIWAHTHAATALADICFEVTFRRKKSELVARKKQEKWAQIPAFLVALVHNNQAKVEVDSDMDETDNFSSLKYSPPMTERQLEDYASASAAIQNAMLSLHAEGVATKWATGPVIHTIAFRQLVQAEPKDRVAGLVMIGGWNSAELSEKEETMAKVRRHRRRKLYGDVLTDLS